MSKKKQQEPKRYCLTGWSDKAIQPVVDRFHEVTGITEFPIEVTETGATFKQRPIININDQPYALDYFTYEPA
jgi:hypothetical protein